MNDSFITVRVGKLPGKIQEVALNGGRTVDAAFAAADLDYSGFSLYVNDTPATPATTVEDGDLILAAKKIKGN